MAKLDAFRKLIREEVRTVLREELRAFLTEIKKPVGSTASYTNTLKESLIKQSPKLKQKAPVNTSNNPLADLLVETAHGMNGEDYRTLFNATSDMAQGFPQMFQQADTPVYNDFVESRQPQVVESVTDMLANTRPTSDINQVSIDVVPDFTELMQTMKNRGSI